MALPILLCAFLSSMFTAAAGASSYDDDWNRSDPQWVALTNHLTWCHLALVERYAAAGRGTNDVYRPAFTDPMRDYEAFATNIDSVATNYVCHTNADAAGAFDSWFAQASPPFGPDPSIQHLHTNRFPMFSVSNLHAAAGFTDWTDSTPLRSWAADTGHVLAVRVEQAILALKWTCAAGVYSNRLTVYEPTCSVFRTSSRRHEPGDPENNAFPPVPTEAQRTLTFTNTAATVLVNPTSVPGYESLGTFRGVGWYCRQYTLASSATLQWSSLQWSWADRTIETDFEDWCSVSEGYRSDIHVLVSPPSTAQVTAVAYSRFEPFIIHHAIEPLCTGVPGGQWVWDTYQHDYYWVTANTCGNPVYSPYDPATSNSAVEGIAEFLEHDMPGSQYSAIREWVPGRFGITGGYLIKPASVPDVYRAGTHMVLGSLTGTSQSNLLAIAPSQQLPFPSAPSVSNSGSESARFVFTATNFPGVPPPPDGPPQPYFDDPAYSVELCAATTYEMHSSPAIRIDLPLYNDMPLVLLKWHFAHMAPPRLDNTVPPMPDNDLDGVVRTPLPLSGPAARCGGILSWTVDQDDPCLVLPVTQPVGWFAGLPVHGYLTGTRVLPYQYVQGWNRSRDGDHLAYSLNTRVLESGMAATTTLKRAAVLRPNGSVVTFEFAAGAGGAISDLGVPTGEHRFRSYVLQDVTPASHTDLRFELRFADGITHEFGNDGSLSAVRHVEGQVVPLNLGEGLRAVPGTCGWVLSSNGCPVAASNGWFNSVKLTWSEHTNRLESVEYRAETTIQTVWPDIRNQRVESLRKDLFPESGSILAGSKLTFGSGLWITRTVAGDTVTIQRNTPEWGTLRQHDRTNEGCRVKEHVLEVNGSSATTKWTYDPDTGRYPSNQLLKASLVTKVKNPDGAETTFQYAPETGWVTGIVSAVGNGALRNTVYDYASHGSAAPASGVNLIEPPRTVTGRYDTTTVARTLYAHYLGGSLIVQRCPTPDAGWNAVSNLVSLRLLHTDVSSPDLLGQVLRLVEPAQSLTVSNSLTNAELKSIQWDSRGRHSTNVSFASGVLRGSDTFENGVLTCSLTNTVDALGRPVLSSNRIDGTWTEDRNWGISGPGQVREADGSLTTLSYFPAGGLRRIQQPALGLTTTYERDPLGNATRTTVTGGGKSYVTEQRVDAQGRFTSVSDPVGATTYAYQQMPSGSKTIASRSGQGDVVRERYLDGSPKSVAGPGTATVREWEYGITNGLYYVRETRGRATNRQWETTCFNLLGQVAESRRSGATNSTSFGYDDKGRLQKERDPTGVTRLYAYDGSNRLEHAGIDRNGNGTLDAASADRFVTYRREVTTNGVGFQTLAYPSDGSTATVFIAVSTNAIDGRSGVTVRGNTTSSWHCSAWQPGGAYTSTVSSSDGRQSVSVYDRWRQAESRAIETNAAVTETVVYRNHALGYTERIEHSRRGTTTIGYNAAFLKETVTQPGLSASSRTEYWPGTDWVRREIGTDASIVQQEYWPNGNLKRMFDTATYPAEYDYDQQGNRTCLRTFRDGHPVNTRWDFDSDTGLLGQKRLQGLAFPLETYAYRDNGQLASITDIRGIERKFSFDPATGDRTGMTVSDGLTAPLTYASDRLGRTTLARFAGGIEETFAWTLAAALATNAVAGYGQVPDVEFSYLYSTDHGAVTQMQATFLGELPQKTACFYDAGARMIMMTNPVGELACSYVPGSTLLSGQTFFRHGDPKLTRTITWDLVRDLPTNIAYRINGAVVASFGYHYQTNADRIARMTLPDGTYWTYDYDPLGQLKKAERFLADGTPCLGGRFGYRYDEIGNLVAGGPADVAGDPRYRFECNDLNAHALRHWSNIVDVSGTAVTNTAVTVNDRPAQRQGDRFLCELPVDNAAGSLHTSVVVKAVSTTGAVDLVAERQGGLYVPRADEPLLPDAAGEIASDSRYAYQFDGNWRLVTLVATNTVPPRRLTFGYYADGRRAWKKVETWQGGAWTLKRRHQFSWDRWTLVRETVDDYGTTPALREVRTYLWALDLSGRTTGRLSSSGGPTSVPARRNRSGGEVGAPDGAGGIDGLVAVSVEANGVTRLYLPVMDHQGTVRHVVDAATEQIVASFDYAPYGELLAETGDPAAIASVPFRFQTKYYDRESGLLYFGHRYYAPSTGKWLTRDPLQERGGINMTAAFDGNSVTHVDPFGLAGGMPTETPELLYYRILSRNQYGVFVSNDAFGGRPNVDDRLTQESFFPLCSFCGWKIALLHQAYTYGRQKGLPDVDYRDRWTNYDPGVQGSYRFDIASLSAGRLSHFGPKDELQFFVSTSLDYMGHALGKEVQNGIHSWIHSDYIDIPYIDNTTLAPSLTLGGRYRLTGPTEGTGLRTFASARGEVSPILPNRLSLLLSLELETTKWHGMSLYGGTEVGLLNTFAGDDCMDPMYSKGVSPTTNVSIQWRLGILTFGAHYVYHPEGWDRSLGGLTLFWSTDL